MDATPPRCAAVGNLQLHQQDDPSVIHVELDDGRTDVITRNTLRGADSWALTSIRKQVEHTGQQHARLAMAHQTFRVIRNFHERGIVPAKPPVDLVHDLLAMDGERPIAEKIGAAGTRVFSLREKAANGFLAQTCLPHFTDDWAWLTGSSDGPERFDTFTYAKADWQFGCNAEGVFLRSESRDNNAWVGVSVLGSKTARSAIFHGVSSKLQFPWALLGINFSDILRTDKHLDAYGGLKLEVEAQHGLASKGNFDHFLVTRTAEGFALSAVVFGDLADKESRQDFAVGDQRWYFCRANHSVGPGVAVGKVEGQRPQLTTDTFTLGAPTAEKSFSRHGLCLVGDATGPLLNRRSFTSEPKSFSSHLDRDGAFRIHLNVAFHQAG
jgi:hypothetical protein